MSPVAAQKTTPRPRPPSGGRRYRMTIAYDGTGHFGWQAQPHQATVQGALETALRQLTGETVRVHSCGRTDTGVHARAQVAHFDLRQPWEAGKLQKALNAVLPAAIRVPELRRTRPDFHARYDAQGKEYRYMSERPGDVPAAPLAGGSYPPAAGSGSHAFGGGTTRGHAHDFAAFRPIPTAKWRHGADALAAGGAQAKALVVISALGDGFLYKMVRSLVGHLLRVGRGVVPAAETTPILQGRLRTARVETAPAHGLCLWKIHYGAIPGLPKPDGL